MEYFISPLDQWVPTQPTQHVHKRSRDKVKASPPSQCLWSQDLLVQ